MRRLTPLLVLLLLAALAWLGWTVLSTDGGNAAVRDVGQASPVAAGMPEAPTGDTPEAVAPARARVREHAAVPIRDEGAAEEMATTTFTVRVVDLENRPVPGVALDFRAPALEGEAARRTRSDGRASWDGPATLLPYDIEVGSPLFDAQPLRDAETVIVVDDLLPLEIEFVDQETGRPVEVAIAGSPLESDNVLSYRHLSRYVAKVAPVRRGRDADFWIDVDAPEGWVLPDSPVVRAGFISRYATAVRSTVPVAREVPLTVRVLRHDGSPAPDATISASVTGARTLSTTTTESTGGDGIATIRSLPFLRGERLTVSAMDADGRVAPTEEAVLVDADRPLSITLRLPEEAGGPWIGRGGGASSRFSCRADRRHLPAGTARLTVTLTRRNGLPAAGARVLLSGPNGRTGRANDAGRVEFVDLTAGTYRVTLREPGLVTTTDEVTLVDGESRAVAVQETAGRAATLRVVDADGLPLPNVRVVVELPWGEQHVQLDNAGVQRLDHWTDVSGRVRFTDLPAGKLSAVATLGSRRVVAELGDDETVLALPNR